MKRQFQSNVNGQMLGGGSIEHPLSIHSASIGTRWKPRGMQLICTLVLLFTFAIGNVWAVDPTLSFGTTSATTSTYLGTYETEGITISSDRSYSSGMVQLGSTPSSYNSYYVQVSAGVAIDSIHVLMSGNGSNKNLHAPMFGWATSATSNNADTYSYPAEQTTSGNGYTYAKWFKYDMTGASVKCTRIYRSVKNVSSANPSYTGSSTALGSGQTIQIYGMKIWLHKHTVTLNPNGGSYASTPEGWTLSEGKYTKAVFAGSLALPEPTNSGNTFAGWKNKNNEDVASPITVSKDTVLTAQWTPTGGTQSAITYNNTKGAANSNPDTYYEGTGIASFAALADVDGFHFTGWNPPSIAADASGPKTINATWVPTYNVSFDKGAGSGSAPEGFQKWEGAKFNLPGQGEMVAPAGKAFDGWKVGVSDKYAAGAEYTMGTTSVEFVAQWKNAPTVLFSMEASAVETYDKVAAGATLALTTANELASISGGTAEYKNNNTGERAVRSKQGGVVYFMLEKTGSYFAPTLTSPNTLQEGDTIYASVYGGKDNRGIYFTISPTDNTANEYNLQTGSGADANSEIQNLFYVIKEGDELIGASTIYIQRYTGNGTYFKSFRIIRPAQKDIKSTTYDLTAVKINGTAISESALNTLKTSEGHLLNITDPQYAAAPTLKFARKTTITYEDDSQKVTNDTITVTATEEESKWQAQATIGTITYTVKMAKVSAATITYKLGTKTLGSEVVAINGHPVNFANYQSLGCATFNGWFDNSGLTGDAVTMASAVISKDTTFYASFTYLYASSFNIEQWVLTNGAGKGSSEKTDALMSALGTAHYQSNIAWVDGTTELDALNNSKSDSLRNYSYLGLKVKESGKLLNFRVAPSSVVKVKFGELKMTPQVKINDGEYAAMSISSGVYTYTATGEDLLSIYINEANKAVVFKQIMIDADLVDVMKNISYATAQNGSISGLKLGIPGETIKVYPKADEGYVVNSVTVNGAVITPDNGVYSFEMPSADAAVAATFEVYTPPTFTVTYKANNGTEAYVVDDDASVVADNTFAYADHIFLGWNTQADGNGVNYAVGAAVSESLELYAQWMEFSGCFYYLPTKPAEAVTFEEDDLVPGANGGSIKVLGNTMKNTQYGLSFESSGTAAVLVTLSRNMEAGTVIKSKIVVNPNSDKARGLLLRDATNSNTVQDWNKVPTQNPDTFEFTYEVQANDALAGTNQFCIKRVTNAWLISLMVSNCAPEQYTVTYKDGENILGTEGVYENGHPTAAGIYTRKLGYVLDGWSLTDGGELVELSTITITEDKTLYAKYSERDCSPMGVKFSMEAAANEWSSDYQPDGNTIVSLADYATISGGEAYVGNGSSSKHVKVLKTSSAVQLTGSAGFIRILLDCPLAANDTIKLDNTNKCIVSIDSLKAKKANLASGSHAYVAPAEWADADTIYVWRDGNNVDFTSIQVIRPEIYSVSFNMMGHGSDIADITGVVKGSKIAAPTAPTDENYAFAGWYKENTLSNAWDFDNDVVTANTTLYAKWLDMSDATLKSLKYGANDIALQDGVYEYNVELPSYTTAVPALTAETSNPNASAVVADDAAFDESGNAQSTVTVTPQKVGADQQVYTVNFTHAAALPQVDVTETTVWDFTNGNAAASKITLNYVDVVLANVAGVKTENINAQALLVNANYISNAQLQAKTIMFRTTVPGQLTIRYGCTSGKGEGNERTLYINDLPTTSATYGTDMVEYKQIVPAGEVTIKAMYGETPTVDIMNYRYIEFKTADYARNVSNNIGTLCVDHNVPAGQYLGATFYQIASRNEEYDFKIDFEEVLPNEELKAGEPYIFQSTTGRIDLFYGETIAPAPVDVRGMHGWFSNTEEFTKLDITEENMSDILYISQNKLWSCENLVDDDLGLKVVNNRAYIVMSEVPTYANYVASQQNNGAPRRRVTMGRNGEQSATGFENIEASEKPMKIMINGQIFILRGEKMFDATGRLVK